jgi:hypothetical protein
MLATLMPPARRAGLLAREVDGEVVILDRETGDVHRLNATASFIWNQCDGKTTAAEIAARLAATFEGAPQSPLGVVVEAIADLERRGLLAP